MDKIEGTIGGLILDFRCETRKFVEETWSQIPSFLILQINNKSISMTFRNLPAYKRNLRS